MPELSTDVFQWLILGLLGLMLLVLVLALVTLGRIRRAAQRTSALAEASDRPTNGSEEPAPERAPHGRLEETAQQPALAPRGRPGRGATAASDEAAELDQGAAQTPRRADRSASSPAALDTGAYLRAQSTRDTEASQQTQGEQLDRPSLAREPAVETREQPAIASVQEPEEQPFERNGRWWFRRDDELLLYDEQTGQWGPAPQDDAAVSAPSGGGREATDVTSVLPAQRPSNQEPVGEESFWKCRSCGAVNAAAETSCRMCFTPRGLG
jgi:hypothetical protein